MNLLQTFLAFIKKENLFQPQDRLLLAVSGGVDSVVLCELCHQAGFDFAIAHCNFQLRGQESERDANFVKDLATQYNMPLFYKTFDTNKYAIDNKVSIQVAARELRYEWFYSLINSSTNKPFNHILTAHHQDDNIETMLMHFFKGTGIAGLRGMLPKQHKIIRPLLFASRNDIEIFAEKNGLKWVEDSSNQSDKYTRNYFRHQLLPLVQVQFPQVMTNLSGNLERFREIEILYQQSIQQHKKKLLEFRGNEVHIPALKLKKSEPLQTIVYEIIKDYSFTPHQVKEVINLLESESGKYVQSPTHRIIKNRSWLIIAPNQPGESETILIEEATTTIQFAGFNLKLEKLAATNYQLSTDNAVACVSADAIKFPLLLRPWKQGDYFYPLGMQKKKKLSRFFIDQKLSKIEKENIWVLEMDKKIIWIVGHRIDDRFKVLPTTKEVLKFSVTK
jgi:tRNA(Ile)-lysidine synthase